MRERLLTLRGTRGMRPPQNDSPPYIWVTNIPNFGIAPGHDLYGEVVFTNGIGRVTLINVDVSAYFTMDLAPPHGASFSGNTAEWIMESAPGEPTSSLPRFNEVHFTSAQCGTTSAQADRHAREGDIFNIVGFGARPARTRPIIQPRQARRLVPAPPVDHRLPVHPDPPGDLGMAHPVRGQQHDPRPLRQSCRPGRRLRPGHQLFPVSLMQSQRRSSLKALSQHLPPKHLSDTSGCEQHCAAGVPRSLPTCSSKGMRRSGDKEAVWYLRRCAGSREGCRMPDQLISAPVGVVR
jgi:peptidase A4-like protein